MVAACEGMVLGEKLGIDPKTLMNVLSTATSNSWVISANNPFPGNIPTAPASNNYNGGFQVGLMRKDMALGLECAEAVDAESQFAQAAMEYYRTLEKKGHGGKDFGYIF